jgi:hypothetical protein
MNSKVKGQKENQGATRHQQFTSDMATSEEGQSTPARKLKQKKNRTRTKSKPKQKETLLFHLHITSTKKHLGSLF